VLADYNIIKQPDLPNSMKFPKNDRLCGKKIIDKLFKNGKHFTEGCLKTIYIYNSNPETTGAKVLIAAPRKLFRNAVVRNRIKRLVREAYRRQRYILDAYLMHCKGTLYIAFVYNGMVEAEYSDIENKIVLSLQRLISIINKQQQENDNKNT